MKRILLSFLCLGAIMSIFAQVNSNGITAIKMRPSPIDVERAFRNGIVDFQKSHPYKKQIANTNFNLNQRSGSRAVSFDTLGSAGNAFTILDGSVNRISANQTLNSVMFIHRADPIQDPGSNVAQYKYDITKNGGADWDLNIGPLTPTLENFDTAGRFPQALLYNPAGNTNPNNAQLVYYGTWLPFGGSGNGRTWDGVVTGAVQTNGTLTGTEDITRPNNGDINVAKSLVEGLPGQFWTVNFTTVPGDSLAINDVLVSKGIWNNNTSNVDWTHQKLNVPFVINADNSANAATVNIAFSPDGQDGWIAMLSDVSADDDSTLNPVFYRTIDGGVNWTGPTEIRLTNFANIKDALTLDTIANSAFDADLVVDANGNPHLVTVVGSSGGTGYSIATRAANGDPAGLKIYDITFNPNVSVDCQWQALLLDDVATFRGTLSTAGGTDFNEDNRPQASRSEDGNVIFFGWLDSDPALVTDDANELPNFKGRAINIQTGAATAVVNFTETDAIWSGSALFASVSPTLLVSGNTFKIPTVFMELNPVSGGADDPANFYYINNIQFNTADFNTNLGADIPVITLTGENPQYIYLGDSYTELGATADDCNDGDLTNSVDVNTSALNTNSRGNYNVDYSVTDSDNNTANTARQIIVNTEPDAKFGFSFPSGLTVAFRDSSLYDPTAWQWNFGDGNGSSLKNPSRTYAAAGTYTVCLKARNNYNQAPFSKPIDEECKTVVVTTSIENKEVDAAFSVYPNPNKGVFNIELINSGIKTATIEIYNVIGSKITSLDLNLVKSNNFKMDLTNQPNGIYLIKFITEKGNAVKNVSIIQ